MNVTDVLTQARDSITVQRVFGEPIDHGHVTVVPVARVGRWRWRGQRRRARRRARASATAWVPRLPGSTCIDDDHVKWQPAVDVNRVILGGQIVAIVLLLTIRALARMRARKRWLRFPRAPRSRPRMGAVAVVTGAAGGRRRRGGRGWRCLLLLLVAVFGPQLPQPGPSRPAPRVAAPVAFGSARR